MPYTFEASSQAAPLSGHLRMGGANPAGEWIDANSRHLIRAGKPWAPVMGEFHFSRFPRAGWYDALCKMKAGGVTIAATYLFWLHHEEAEGAFDFSGANDLRGFLLEAQRAGLEVFLRLGPWCHGEARNGGFPDWLLRKPFEPRGNDPGYLDYVRRLFRQYAAQTQGLLYRDGGPVIGVQLENELTRTPEHLLELKRIAIACGFDVPLYSATGWNDQHGAMIPVDELLPMYGGYCDEPWSSSLEQLPPREGYFFNRNPLGENTIGTDLLRDQAQGGAWQLPWERYPYMCCELGGGVQNTHHRRIAVRPIDVYAMALVTLGNGCNLPGYYVYHGGTNRIGKLSTFQESLDTGYPNDLPILSYDFQAPLSEYGEARGHYGLLNMLHLFLADFGEVFAPMAAVDAASRPARNDTAGLRYAMRSDGESGFVFVNHYQRLYPIDDLRGVVIDTGHGVAFPPIDILGETAFFLPYNIDLPGGRLRYATAQLLCRQGDTVFFAEIPGIPAEYSVDGNVKIVTLPWAQAQTLRKLGGELLLGDGCDLYLKDGEICAIQPGEFTARRWQGDHFEAFRVGAPYEAPRVTLEETAAPPFESEHMWQLYGARGAFRVPRRYEYAAGLHRGAPRDVRWRKIAVAGEEGFVAFPSEGDVMQIYDEGGTLLADWFDNGLPWRVPAQLLAGKTCYLGVSQRREDCYREFPVSKNMIDNS